MSKIPIDDYACLDCYNVDINVNPSPHAEGIIEVINMRDGWRKRHLVTIKSGQKHRCTVCGSQNTTDFSQLGNCTECFYKNKGEKVRRVPAHTENGLSCWKCPKCGHETRSVPVE